MLFELIIFALVLSVGLMVALVMGGLLLMNIMTSEKVMSKYTKKCMNVVSDIIVEEE